jgi:hypothetical protein
VVAAAARAGARAARKNDRDVVTGWRESETARNDVIELNDLEAPDRRTSPPPRDDMATSTFLTPKRDRLIPKKTERSNKEEPLESELSQKRQHGS